ncbi:MAG: hypothetical protein IV107_22085 [Paucibacter sp.]|nr:hypothetical protein [Roseateles sp.]
MSIGLQDPIDAEVLPLNKSDHTRSKPNAKSSEKESLKVFRKTKSNAELVSSNATGLAQVPPCLLGRQTQQANPKRLASLHGFGSKALWVETEAEAVVARNVSFVAVNFVVAVTALRCPLPALCLHRKSAPGTGLPSC